LIPCDSHYETTDPQRRRPGPARRGLNIHWIRWRFLFTGAELVVIDAIRARRGQLRSPGALRALRSHVELQIVAPALGQPDDQSSLLPNNPSDRPLVSNAARFPIDTSR